MKVNIDGLERILEAQKELDKAILKEAGFKEGEYPAEEIRIAYLVELGELAQEWKGFKYWKKTGGEIDRSKLIEEYADCLHFASSLVNDFLKVNPGMKRIFDTRVLGINLIDEELKVGETFLECSDSYNNSGFTFLISTLMLGKSLKFTWEEIEEAYFKKNKINWDRLNGGY